jgi:capsular exopolysaccharide synthesis family protein
VELRQQFAFVRASLPLIIVSTILALAVAFGVSSVLPPNYEASVLLNVGQSSSGITNDSLQVSQRLSLTYARLAVRDSAATTIIGELGLDTTKEELLKHVRSEADVDSTLLTITVDDPDPARAAAIANAFAAELLKAPSADFDPFAAYKAAIEQDLVDLRSQIDEVQAQVDRLSAIANPTVAQTTQLDGLLTQSATLRGTFAQLAGLANSAPANRIAIADPATAPIESVSPRVLLNAILGGLLGLVLGVSLAFIRRRLDDTVRNPEEVEALTGLSSLGTIVRMPGDDRRPLFYRLATLLYPRSPAAEGFRHIRTSVEFAAGDTPIRSVLVTSAMPGDGKTTFASNLAIAYAQAGRKVCLVDGDLRKPELHTMFRIPNETGLSDLLRGHDVPFESVTMGTEVPGLRVLPSGVRPANPAELVASGRMRQILTNLLDHVDLVVIDTPPIQAVTDAALLASLADGTILVAASGKTRRAAIVRARDTLARVGANVLGTALNGVSEQDGKDAALGYFTYYGAPDPSDDDTGSAGPTSGRSPAVAKPIGSTLPTADR